MAIKGFFSKAEIASVRQPPSSIPRCAACGLYKTCQSPKMPVTGEGRRKVLIIAEAPGAEEDKQGVQLIGEAGQLLRRCLREIGVDLDKDCWKTNACICRPPENATPDDKKIEACRPNVLKAVRELDPEIIILLGGTAVKSLIGYVWKEEVGAMTRWAGWRIPYQKSNHWICPTFHPSYVLRENKKNKLVENYFKKHLKAAFQLSGRPRRPEWYEIEKKIKLIFNVEEAARWLRNRDRDYPIAFDYEANRLKPYPSNREIVSCSVCWAGKETIAYPWHGEAIVATKELLESECEKFGANIKFEDNWSKVYGIRVRNWKHDTLVGAHVLDNRQGIVGVKFQAFVLLGNEAWDQHARPFFENNDENGLNQIRKVDLRDLLLYNGIDSYVEYQIAEIQRKQLQEAAAWAA